jgi:hypothetical protein
LDPVPSLNTNSDYKDYKYLQDIKPVQRCRTANPNAGSFRLPAFQGYYLVFHAQNLKHFAIFG